jgi:hypothetical protein
MKARVLIVIEWAALYAICAGLGFWMMLEAASK